MFKRCVFVLGVLWALLPAAAQEPVAVERLVPQVLNVYPHDPTAFTQGLLYHDGKLYESTGLRGASSLREVEITTGAVLRNLPVRRPPEAISASTPEYFAEGLERIEGRLIQLTWTEQEALVYDLATFTQIETIPYEGEGWGLCHDGRYFYMSDSTNALDIRETDTFDLIVSFLVTIEGQPLQPNLLNELECVGDHIYANLWQTNYIVRIDKFSGAINGIIDASSLLTPEEQATLDSNQVLNGIAYNPDQDVFYITGKQWSKLFEVRFVPAPTNTTP
jgi:glutaminyl-peptide cyclotransferase